MYDGLLRFVTLFRRNDNIAVVFTDALVELGVMNRMSYFGACWFHRSIVVTKYFFEDGVVDEHICSALKELVFVNCEYIALVLYLRNTVLVRHAIYVAVISQQ